MRKHWTSSIFQNKWAYTYTEHFIQQEENTHFFASAPGTFSGTDHMLGHKISPRSCKNTEIIPITFSDHNGIKLEISKSKKTEKFTNMLKLNNTILKN